MNNFGQHSSVITMNGRYENGDMHDGVPDLTNVDKLFIPRGSYEL